MGTRFAPHEVVRGDDPLPTQTAVHRVKALAWAAACEKAWALGWPVDEPALEIIRRTPVVAHLALVRLCPEVDALRLARCLRLEPEAVIALGLGLELESVPWAREVADGIAEQVRNEMKGRG